MTCGWCHLTWFKVLVLHRCNFGRLSSDWSILFLGITHEPFVLWTRGWSHLTWFKVLVLHWCNFGHLSSDWSILFSAKTHEPFVPTTCGQCQVLEKKSAKANNVNANNANANDADAKNANVNAKSLHILGEQQAHFKISQKFSFQLIVGSLPASPPCYDLGLFDFIHLLSGQQPLAHLIHSFWYFTALSLITPTGSVGGIGSVLALFPMLTTT